MDPDAKREFIRLRHLAADDDWEDMSMDVDPSTSVNIDAVLEGSERIELSHAGGELRQSIEEEMEEEIIIEVAHASCPQLAIQSFVKTLCDLHGVCGIPHIFSLFYVCQTPYLPNSEKTVLKSLGRDSFSWRLQARMSGLHSKLIYDILVTMDGNNSLKRVLRRCKVHSDGDTGTDAEFILVMPATTTIVTGEKVNEWSKQRIAEMMPKEAIESDEPNPCADRCGGIFDEAGIFLCLCRHGFVLMIVDMIKSGEFLIEHLGDNIGNGYDVGCDFQTTIKNSPLAARARQCNFRCLVGAFHGHAHNRLCQLCNLATYVLGLGCEDLEGCERFFSGSNGLAKSCRYASRFHRQQEITSYCPGKFITNNYKQAIDILKKEEALRTWMREEGILDYSRRTFLLGLKEGSKDQTETLEMEYVQKVVNLDTSREKVDRALEAVHELEEKLGISDRWTSEVPTVDRYCAADQQKKYQKALDAVELLVVERIFELTKINQSQTGYKLRRHIAKALQARSKRFEMLLIDTMRPAIALDPPMASLTWEQVVEYTFLADFDILRDTRAEVQSRPWTRPAYRLAMDTYFKIERAREEIIRLNIEIRRMMTWQQRGRFDDDHRNNFRRLTKMKGFTGSISPGRAVENWVVISEMLMKWKTVTLRRRRS
ncbi:hypothetical protein B0H14DRAFT_3101747 [Mycena olivaceomarginata]|nr:hypothetical protein B0H14DRAFT_3101747 [Mycena olivaceomarginata]